MADRKVGANLIIIGNSTLVHMVLGFSSMSPWYSVFVNEQCFCTVVGSCATALKVGNIKSC